MNNSAETTADILKVAEAMRQKGKPFPTAVIEIPNIPFSSFTELLSAIRSSSVILQRFSTHFDNNIFEMVATRFQRNLNTLYIASAFLVPVLCFVLAFIYSWWWLVGLLVFPLALGRAKKLYNRVILSSALSSELYFCFLYATGQVCITTSDFEHSYYWQS